MKKIYILISLLLVSVSSYASNTKDSLDSKILSKLKNPSHTQLRSESLSAMIYGGEDLTKANTVAA